MPLRQASSKALCPWCSRPVRIGHTSRRVRGLASSSLPGGHRGEEERQASSSGRQQNQDDGGIPSREGKVSSTLFDPFEHMASAPKGSRSKANETSFPTVSRDFLQAGFAPEPKQSFNRPPSRMNQAHTKFLSPEERSRFADLFKAVQNRAPQQQHPLGSKGTLGSMSDSEIVLSLAKASMNRRKNFKETMREGSASQISAEEMERGRDRAKEEMAACRSEAELWTWAEQSIWGKEGGDPPPYGIRSPFYATALGDLLVRLRDTYRNPHAALAVYQRTRELGLDSLVIGCTAYVYSEVIRTRWGSLRDLKGVLDTVREARRAGVLSATAPRGTALNTRTEEGPIRDLIAKVRTAVYEEVLPKPSNSGLGMLGITLDPVPGEDTVARVNVDFAGRIKLDMVDEIFDLIEAKRSRTSESSGSRSRKDKPVFTPRASSGRLSQREFT